jgi:hypothetical protein
MPLDGKRVNELSRVSKTTEDALLVVDNGGKELNSIFVRDLVVSSSSGNGFDFIGTEEEFNTALLSGKITDETVSLVTDDVYSIDEELGGIKESLNNKADLSLGNATPSKEFIENAIAWSAPDFTAGVDKGWANFTAESYGWIYVYSALNEQTVTVSVNGAEVYRNGNNGYADYIGSMARVSKGESVTVSGSARYGASITFYPCKGVTNG